MLSKSLSSLSFNVACARKHTVGQCQYTIQMTMGNHLTTYTEGQGRVHFLSLLKVFAVSRYMSNVPGQWKIKQTHEVIWNWAQRSCSSCLSCICRRSKMNFFWHPRDFGALKIRPYSQYFMGVTPASARIPCLGLNRQMRKETNWKHCTLRWKSVCKLDLACIVGNGNFPYQAMNQYCSYSWQAWNNVLAWLHCLAVKIIMMIAMHDEGSFPMKHRRLLIAMHAMTRHSPD